MSAADVEKTIREVVETVAQSGLLFRRHETGMRCVIVGPILWALGWSTWLPWERQPHYDRGRRGTVDYALFDSHGDVAVLIQVQNARTRRRHDHIRLRENTRGLSHGAGVLTYGFCREVYDLSRTARDIEDKRVEQLIDFDGVPVFVSWTRWSPTGSNT